MTGLFYAHHCRQLYLYMQVDYLIIGQGICGTMLSWFLHKEGRSFCVLDDGHDQSASKVAAGLISPVTGRRYSPSWMIDTLLPFALESYGEMGRYLDIAVVSEKSIIDFFPAPNAREAFLESMERHDNYLHAYPDQNHFNRYFEYLFGCGEVRPACSIHLSLLLASWRRQLQQRNCLLETSFNAAQLELGEDSVRYGPVTARRVIFCDGIASMHHPWFSLLPWAPNKGEAVIIESPELTAMHIFKKGTMLVPLPEKDLFWVGAGYQWNFSDALPTPAYREQVTAALQSWLKVPFTIISQKAAVRPATVERRPFVGLHPHLPAMGILNGMGTKGTSLAPFFARQLVQHIEHGLPLTDAADVRRFSRILSR